MEDRLRRIEEAQRRMEEAIDQMAKDFYGPHRPGVAGGGRDHTKGVKGMVEDLWDRGANGGPGLDTQLSTKDKALMMFSLVVATTIASVVSSVLG